MSSDSIERVELEALQIPTDTPEADGTLCWNSTTLLVAHISAAGERGLGLAYGDAATARLASDALAPVVMGRRPGEITAIWRDMQARVRNLGRLGEGAMAISLLDTALWDLKARLLGIPLLDLLGAARPYVPAYASGGFTSYGQVALERQACAWIESGFSMAKIKVGTDPDSDLERVGVVRDVLGPDVELFVDANGAYDRKQALGLASQFAEFGVTWFEEPVSSDDREGLRLLRDRVPAPMEIAAGEYAYDVFGFLDLLRSNAVDVLQADATRCMGVSGFLRAAALCEAFSVPLSAHCAPALHTTLCCAVPSARHVEYFEDHARIERLLFEGAPEPAEGWLTPSKRPGLGLRLRENVARAFRIPLSGTATDVPAPASSPRQGAAGVS